MRHTRWNYRIDPTKKGFYWPESRKKKEYYEAKRTDPGTAQAVYQCNPAAAMSFVFMNEDFQNSYTAPSDLHMGVASPEVRQFIDKGDRVIQAWDTAFSAESRSDYSVCVTALLVADDRWHKDEAVKFPELGPCEPHYRVFILEVFRDRLTFSQVVQAMRSQFLKWQPSVVAIEKKAYGVGAIETLQGIGMPIEPLVPEANKRARAVEGVGAGSVQSWFRQWRVSLPIEADWRAAYVRELMNFTGAKGVTDDQVDATVYAVQLAIRAGAATARLPTDIDALLNGDNHTDGLGLPIIGNDGSPYASPTSEASDYIQRRYFNGASPDVPPAFRNFEEQLMAIMNGTWPGMNQ